MKNMVLSIAAVLTGAVTSAVMWIPTASVADVEPAITIATQATPAQQQWLGESAELFATNGLALPALEVFFFDDGAECGGHKGTYRRNTSPAQIRICSAEPFVLPHELAHAWEAENVTDEIRAVYMVERELSTWSDRGYEWNERGVEDAAFVLQQNLTTTKVSSASSTWQERIAAYEVLTGQPSPLQNNLP